MPAAASSAAASPAAASSAAASPAAASSAASPSSKMQAQKKSPVIPVLTSCLYLMVLVLAVISYIYGSLLRDNERARNLNILAVDYDGAAIGEALRRTYAHFQGPDFPTLHFEPPADFPINGLSNKAICSQGYWGVIYVHAGATQKLLTAVSGNATSYNASDAITFIYSGVRYPVIGQSFVAAKMQQLAAATSSTLHDMSGKALLSAVNSNNPAAVSALLNPIQPSSVVLIPVEQGTRILLNTVTMVVAPLMQFFFLMALDHISLALGVFADPRTRRTYILRLLGSKVFTFFCGLPVAALVYAFREDWVITGSQFVETWLCFAFYMDISYLVVDSVIGTVIPMRFAPFFIFTWIMINVTSTLFPFELSPGFYKVGYALPGHNIWLLLMDIWSRGCVSKLQVALPVLFAWWIIGHVTSARAVWRKCSVAQQSKSG